MLPTLRQLGQEQTTYLVLHIAGFSLSGWQILVLEGIVLLVSVGLILFAVYVFVSASSNGSISHWLGAPEHQRKGVHL